MKKRFITIVNITLLILLFLTSKNIFSQGIKFENERFDTVVAKAKQEDKLLFMDCYTTWCGPCVRLSKEVFPQKNVGDFFNDNFISIKMDMERGEGITLAKKYGITAFPTLLFIDSEGNVVHKLLGFMSDEELIKGAQSALNPDLRVDDLKEKYDNGNRELHFLMTYLGVLKEQHNKEEMTNVSRAIIEKMSLEKIMNKELFHLIVAAKYTFGSDEFNFLLKNRNLIEVIAEPSEYYKVIKKPIYSYLEDYATNCNSLLDLEEVIEQYDKMVGLNVEIVRKRLKLIYYISNGQLRKWFDFKLLDAEQQKGSPHYLSALYEIAGEVLNNPKLCGNKEILDRTINIGHKLVNKENEVIYGNLLLAKLYLKERNKSKALRHFKIFYENNDKAGKNNDRPSIINLKKEIEKLDNVL